MLHIDIHGMEKSTAQGQRVLVSPWMEDTVNTSGPQTIGTSAQQILDISAAGFSAWWVRLQNASVTGQRLAVGFSNAVTIATAGIILEPGDVETFENIDTDLWLISSAAGAVALRFAMRTN